MPNHEPLIAPLAPLGDLRKRRVGDEELRTALGRAAVEAAGEFGYSDLTVDRILERAGVSRAVFYRVFRGREECYWRGHADTARILAAEITRRCGDAPDWPEAVRAALVDLADFFATQTDLASGLIAQAQTVGDLARASREILVDPLMGCLDRGRREPNSISPPPSAAAFALGAIEAAAVQALNRRAPEDFAAWLPGLVFLVVATFLGRDAALKMADG